MFSKINSEFHKHAKGFQIVLGLMIVIPFVFMIPDTDILGPGYSDGAPESVGTINGKSIDWETYQAEAKSFLITQSIQQGAIMNVLQNSRNILSNELLRGDVLNYMARWQEIEAQEKSGKFTDTKVEQKDYKEVIKNFNFILQALNAQAARTGTPANFDVKKAFELLRYNLKIGGAEVDAVMKRIILTKRFETFIKESADVKDEDILARIKKEEKVFKVRTADIETNDFLNDPLKDYYEKNKDTFRDNDAIKASLIVLDPQAYKADILKTDLTKQIEKAFAEEKKTNDQAEKNADAIKRSIKDRIAQSQAREKAKSMATIIESSLKAKIKADSKTADILKNFVSLAKASKLTVQESSFHNQKSVKNNDHPINAKVTEAILSLTQQDSVKVLDDQSKFYVLVFNEKGYFQPIEKVRNELLEAVYKEKANNYYSNNAEEFKLTHRVSTGYIQLYGGLFNAQVTVTPEEAKAIFDADTSYNIAQKKMIQFSYELKADAKDEEKKAAVTALEAFLKKNEAKTAEELTKLVLGKESKIKRTLLSWVSENDLRTGTDKEIVTEAFQTSDKKFTKIFERATFAAVVFVEASRESTPFEEVKQQIIGAERTTRLKAYTEKKSKEILHQLQSVKPNSTENIAKEIAKISKELGITPRTLDDIPGAEMLNNQYAQQFLKAIAQRNGVTPGFISDLSALSDDRPLTRIRSLPNLSKVIGYLVQDKPEGYQPLEDVTDVVYSRLNSADAQKIASEKAIETKQDLEKALAKPEELKNLMSKSGFNEAKEVKFKEADTTLAKVLAEDPKANEFGSSADQNGQKTTLVFIESIKEVSEEDVAKVKAEYEKKVRGEVESKKLQDFWADTIKKYEVKAVQTAAKES